MTLSKREILLLKKEFRKAVNLHIKSQNKLGTIAGMLSEWANVEMVVESMAGDGFGVGLESSDLHMGLDTLIKMLENGEKLTAELIEDNSSF